MDDWVQTIGNKKVFFVSPHLDDAVFSAGGFLIRLAEKTDVTVINVFTKADKKPYTYSAKKYLSLCGVRDADILFKQRKQEDLFALSKHARIINLEFVDAQWRKREVNHVTQYISKIAPEFIHIYPIYRLNIISGKISKHDDYLINDVTKKLLQRIPSNSVVFCPAAFGNHVDHVIVRDICSQIFKNIYYWADFPYITRTQKNNFIQESDFVKWSYKIDTIKKYSQMKKYKSQLSEINMLPKQVQEVFYYKNK